MMKTKIRFFVTFILFVIIVSGVFFSKYSICQILVSNSHCLAEASDLQVFIDGTLIYNNTLPCPKIQPYEEVFYVFLPKSNHKIMALSTHLKTSQIEKFSSLSSMVRLYISMSPDYDDENTKEYLREIAISNRPISVLKIKNKIEIAIIPQDDSFFIIKE